MSWGYQVGGGEGILVNTELRPITRVSSPAAAEPKDREGNF